MPHHRAISEIKYFVKQNKFEVRMLWIRALGGHTFVECVDAMAKIATDRVG